VSAQEGGLVPGVVLCEVELSILLSKTATNVKIEVREARSHEVVLVRYARTAAEALTHTVGDVDAIIEAAEGARIVHEADRERWIAERDAVGLTDEPGRGH